MNRIPLEYYLQTEYSWYSCTQLVEHLCHTCQSKGIRQSEGRGSRTVVLYLIPPPPFFKVTDLHLEGEEEQANADMATQQTRPDAWVVN